MKANGMVGSMNKEEIKKILWRGIEKETEDMRDYFDILLKKNCQDPTQYHILTSKLIGALTFFQHIYEQFGLGDER